MQLCLFEDNLPAVLINIADEYLRGGNLPQAISVYDQMLADTPGDKKVAALREMVGAWLEPLAAIVSGVGGIDLLRSAWGRLDTISLPSLRATVLDLLIEAVRALPNPEGIFAPPRFHLGQMLMEARRFDDAVVSFRAALGNPSLPRGTLLGWYGDALTLAGNEAESLKSYLAAFLDDPLSVDLSSIRNRSVLDLFGGLHSDAGDEIDKDEVPAWLPVWGVLNGIFPLHRHALAGQAPPNAGEFELLLGEAVCPVPRIWYGMLAYAEGLRRDFCDGRQLGAVRRLMKRTNSFMFECYLEKINARR